jgi:hypothetical protein
VSRSYKKVGGFTVPTNKKKERTRASRKFRRTIKEDDETSNFGWYKKNYEQWNICDYNFRVFTKEDEKWTKKEKRYKAFIK